MIAKVVDQCNILNEHIWRNHPNLCSQHHSSKQVLAYLANKIPSAGLEVAQVAMAQVAMALAMG